MLKHGLSFPILSDAGNAAAKRYGIAWKLSGEMQEIYRQFNIDLERFNGDTSWTLPMPARFIIDGRGVIRDAQAHPDYTTRPEPAETLALLKRLFP